MASYSQDQYNPIHFHRVIFRNNLDNIMIPSRFTGRYGRFLSNPVCLKPPDGKEWKVYWTKRGKEFWFQKGWKEFTNFYSLEVGYLVLFKYEGTSQVGVHIIDKSALEIDYPPSMDTSRQEDNLGNLSDDIIKILDEMPPSPEDNLDNLSDDSIEILDEMPPSPEASHSTALSSLKPQKKMRGTTDEDVEMRSFNMQNMPVGMKTIGTQFQGTKLQKSTNADLKLSKQKSEGGKGRRIFNQSKCLNSEYRRRKVLTAVEKDKALEIASSFKSDNPYFIMVMKPSYVSSKSILSVPTTFAKKHLKEECEAVQLQTLDGRIWHAKYRIPKIMKGWTKFVEENDLEVGHVCVFEMIGLSILKVHIFRDAEKGNVKVNSFEKEQRSSTQDPLRHSFAGNLEVNSFKKEQRSSMQDPPLEKASSPQSENPNFMVRMSQAHIHGTSYVYLPNEFAKAHLGNDPKSVTLIVQDKDWTVGYASRNYNKQQSAEFSWGWKQFCKDNDLKEGDICQFDLTQKFKFQVTIFRVAPKHAVHSSS